MAFRRLLVLGVSCFDWSFMRSIVSHAQEIQESWKVQYGLRVSADRIATRSREDLKILQMMMWQVDWFPDSLIPDSVSRETFPTLKRFGLVSPWTW